MRLRFITSTPLDVRRGSGTFVGISVLARALETVGHTVAIERPRVRFPVHTVERMLFNHGLRPSREYDLTVGFDLDGYTLAGHGASHIAALKGVIADELRFERGLTRATMRWQAAREREHALRADRVVTTSRYSADRAREFYGLTEAPAVVPEPIDLGEWGRLLEANPAPASGGFTVLAVGRLYRRKRIDVLLRAASALRGRIAGLSVRIVGTGPEWRELKALWRDLRLGDHVAWLGDVSRAALAREYNGCDVFCHPSVQEGFGIVFLEAMAAGKPIVAARAGAAPEVVSDGVLVEPESVEALAWGIESLYLSQERRVEAAAAGRRRVSDYDAFAVAGRFLRAAVGSGAAAAP